MDDDLMEVYEDAEEELRSQCRLCAKSEQTKYLISIFGPEGRRHALDIKIRKCLPIPVHEDDGMPKSVCMTCLNKLEVSADLVESALQAHCSFLAILTHDPRRAKIERIQSLSHQDDDDDEDESENEEPPEVDIEQMSDSGTVEAEEVDSAVVIKDEPIDLDDEVPDDEEVLFEVSAEVHNEEVQDETPVIAAEVQESASDDMSQVVVSSVNSISLSSSTPANHEESTSLVTSENTRNKAPDVDDSSSNIHSGEVTIKEEPLGSPPQAYSPLTSENEQCSDTPRSHDDEAD